MSAVCIIDTSIYLHILGVPNSGNGGEEIFSDFETKKAAGETLILPFAVIFETGNHIAQIKKRGKVRRQCAEDLIADVKMALKGEAPFGLTNFSNMTELDEWIDDFLDYATRKESFGDLSIVRDWKILCEQNKRRCVYIWSKDNHLSSCIQNATP